MELENIHNRVCKLEEILTHLAKWTNFDLQKLTGVDLEERRGQCHGHVENATAHRYGDLFQDHERLVVVDVNDILNSGVGVEPEPSQQEERDPGNNEPIVVGDFGTGDNDMRQEIMDEDDSDCDVDFDIGPVFKVEVDDDDDTESSDKDDHGDLKTSFPIPTKRVFSSHSASATYGDENSAGFSPTFEVDTGKSLSFSDKSGTESEECKIEIKRGKPKRRGVYVRPVKKSVIVFPANSASLPSPYVSMERLSLSSDQLINFETSVQPPQPQASYTQRDKIRQTITSPLKIRSGIKRRQKCPHCAYTASGKQLLNQHIRTKHEILTKDLPIMPQMKLNTHVKNTHGGIKRYQCYFCEYKTNFYRGLKDHMRKHTGEKPFNCPTCPFATTLSSSLFRHVSIHDSDTVEHNLKCPKCSIDFKTEKDLKQHATLHGVKVPPLPQESQIKKKDRNKSKIIRIADTSASAKPYKCPHCDYTENNAARLRNHIHEIHDSVPVKCPHCPSILKDEYNLRQHMKYAHTLEKSIFCQICPFATKQKSQLNRHTRNVHNIGMECLKCYFCEKKLKAYDALLAHLRLHTGEKPYKCPECPFETLARPDLRMHMILFHKGRTVKVKKKIYREADFKYHTIPNETQKCILCSYVAVNTPKYREHMREMHRKGSKFQCPHCQKEFAQWCSIRHHIRIHAGEKSLNVGSVV